MELHPFTSLHDIFHHENFTSESPSPADQTCIAMGTARSCLRTRPSCWTSAGMAGCASKGRAWYNHSIAQLYMYNYIIHVYEYLHTYKIYIYIYIILLEYHIYIFCVCGLHHVTTQGQWTVHSHTGRLTHYECCLLEGTTLICFTYDLN